MFKSYSIELFFMVLASATFATGAKVNTPSAGPGLKKLSAYQLKLEGDVALLVLGTSHTYNPNDQQVDG